MRMSENIKKEIVADDMLESEIIESALFSVSNGIDTVLKDPERANYIRYRCLLRVMRLKEERKEKERGDSQ